MTYEELGIDPNRLKRDYLKNPYKKRKQDIIPKEDLEYLYNTIKLPRKTIAKLIGLSEVQLIRKLRAAGIKRLISTPKKEIITLIINKYKIDITKLSRNYSNKPLYRNANHKFEIPIKEDLFYLYRTLNMGIKDLVIFFGVQRSCINNWIALYNIQKPHREALLLMYKTNLERYGVANPFKNEKILEKIKKTNLKRYGHEKISCTTHVRKIRAEKQKQTNEKSFKTKKKNGTLGNKSKQEDLIYIHLIQKFKNVKRQYKSNTYPFACDFYIPELDLYIEYQGNWTHGLKAFDNSKNDNSKLLYWQEKAKTSNYYKVAIKTWTITDPLKRKTAKKNNLNRIEFFTMDEFKTWLKQFQ